MVLITSRHSSVTRKIQFYLYTLTVTTEIKSAVSFVKLMTRENRNLQTVGATRWCRLLPSGLKAGLMDLDSLLRSHLQSCLSLHFLSISVRVSCHYYGKVKVVGSLCALNFITPGQKALSKNLYIYRISLLLRSYLFTESRMCESLFLLNDITKQHLGH